MGIVAFRIIPLIQRFIESIFYGQRTLYDHSSTLKSYNIRYNLWQLCMIMITESLSVSAISTVPGRLVSNVRPSDEIHNGASRKCATCAPPSHLRLRSACFTTRRKIIDGLNSTHSRIHCFKFTSAQ